MKRIAKALYLLLIVTVLTAMASAQVATGIPPFSTMEGGPDRVNLGNLNVNFAIPIVSKPGRGIPFNFALVYNSSVWAIGVVNGHTAWVPAGGSLFGWQGTGAITPYVTYTVTLTTNPCGPSNGGPPPYSFQEAVFGNSYVYHDQWGGQHTFSMSTYYSIYNSPGPANSCPPNGSTPSTPQSGPASDSSGYTLTLNPPGGANISGYVVDRSGDKISTPLVLLGNAPASAGYTVQDSNGNKLTFDGSNFTDTMGSSVLSTSFPPTGGVAYTYAAPGGTAQYTVWYGFVPIQTSFGCTGVAEYSNVGQQSTIALVNSIALPDGRSYTFSYEHTPGNSNWYTGRIKSITLPTGGQITYNYTGANSGINCSDGSTKGLTRTLTSPGGTWTYARTDISGNHWQTKRTSPTGDDTVIDFQKSGMNLYETQRQAYQGTQVGGTVLLTNVTCYNGNYVSCTTAGVTSPITKVDAYHQWPGGKTSATETTYTTTGLPTDVKEYDYGVSVGSAPPSTFLKRETSTVYASLGNGIQDRPSSVTVKDGSGNTVAQTTFGYSPTVTALSGTPQHVSVSGDRGNVTTVTRQTSSTASLTKAFTYYDTGMVRTATDWGTSGSGGPNVTTYNYPDVTSTCGNTFATTITLPLLGTTPASTYNCNGGVATQTVDLNGNSTNITYNDTHYWRPASMTDPTGALTQYAYYGVTSAEAYMVSNNGASISEHLTTFDTFGRPIISQQQQAPAGGGTPAFDSTQVTYDAVGRAHQSTVPYVANQSQGAPNGTPETTTTYDALNRPTQVTDGGGGTVTYSYTSNDVLQTVSPAPNGENTKRRQLEYDGLGRLASVCEITAGSGSGTCGQTVAQTGYWTKYTYDALGNLIGVLQNAQSSTQQTRTYIFDRIGRLTSETNPESGTTSYVYDSGSGLSCAPDSPGDVLRKNDANGNWICYSYDALHRLTDVGNSNQSATNPCHRYRYDNTSGILGTRPTGVTIYNALSDLAEAETDNCTWPVTQASMITDEWFSYTARGETADVWESTQNSGGYYHVNAAYWDNGVLHSLSPNFTGVPSQTFGIDSEGRPYSVSASSGQNPVVSTTYNSGSQATRINYGSGDYDTLSYDPNTGRMTQNAYAVGIQSVVGTLTWNQNGSLGQLAISDPLNPANTQTCTYGHDDLSRIASVTCGSTWNQSFTYDPFGNITKSGSSSWMPGYNSSTNRYTLGGSTYDADGNLLSDTINSYTWDVYGNPASVNGQQLVYDGLGRMVEKSGSEQFVYAPGSSQVFATMNGQTPTLVLYPLTSGAIGMYFGSDGPYYTRPDWLGSARINTTQTQTVAADTAYAPFGEQYSTSGNSWYLFGESGHQWTLSGNTGLDDFPFRKYSPGQGRWISPDPAGTGAVDPGNPQSWNRYAYVNNNPMAATDPLGLDCVYVYSSGGYFDYPGDCFSDNDNGYYVDGTVSSVSWDPASGNLTIGYQNNDFMDTVFSSENAAVTNGAPWDFMAPGIPSWPFTMPTIPTQSRGAGPTAATTDLKAATLLQHAYCAASAGRLQGLKNIYANSTGQYDFGWNPQYAHTTWNVNGQTLDSNQMGNFIAGFQAAVYDRTYSLTTGGGTATLGVLMGGLYYHMRGKTHAQNDPWDNTGRPDIEKGWDAGTSYSGGSCR